MNEGGQHATNTTDDVARRVLLAQLTDEQAATYVEGGFIEMTLDGVAVCVHRGYDSIVYRLGRNGEHHAQLCSHLRKSAMREFCTCEDCDPLRRNVATTMSPDAVVLAHVMALRANPRLLASASAFSPSDSPVAPHRDKCGRIAHPLTR